MKATQLKVKHRTEKGKNKVKKLKKEGFIPAVIYGNNEEPIHITIFRNDLIKIYKGDYGRNVILDLQIEESKEVSKNEHVISYQFDIDHLKHQLIHVDFKRVKETDPVRIEVPLILKGSPPGVKEGGILIKKMSSITIECLPNEIPVSFDVDMSALGLGDFFTVSDLNLDDTYTLISHPDNTIIRVPAPKGKTVEEEEEAAAAAAAGEGKVSDKTKEDASSETKDDSGDASGSADASSSSKSS